MAKDPERMSFKELQEYELKVKKAKASVQERNAIRCSNCCEAAHRIGHHPA